MNTYAKGKRTENKIIKYLEERGYTAVKLPFPNKNYRGPRDLFGRFDIVATSKKELKLIQSKSNKSDFYTARKWLMSATEFEDKKGIGAPEFPKNVSCEVWLWENRKEEPEIAVVN